MQWRPCFNDGTACRQEHGQRRRLKIVVAVVVLTGTGLQSVGIPVGGVAIICTESMAAVKVLGHAEASLTLRPGMKPCPMVCVLSFKSTEQLHKWQTPAR